MTPPQLPPVPPAQLACFGAPMREASAANRIVSRRLAPQWRSLADSRAPGGHTVSRPGSQELSFA